MRLLIDPMRAKQTEKNKMQHVAYKILNKQ